MIKNWLETVLKPLTSQKMSDFEWQTKGIFQGIAGTIAWKIATVCRQKTAFYGRQRVLKQFLSITKYLCWCFSLMQYGDFQVSKITTGLLSWCTCHVERSRDTWGRRPHKYLLHISSTYLRDLLCHNFPVLSLNRGTIRLKNKLFWLKISTKIDQTNMEEVLNTYTKM